MEELRTSLKCKDFDAWVSFLGRLDKVGSDYIIKNDCYLACEKKCMPSSTEKYPGKHIVRDPFAPPEDSGCYVKHGVYVVEPLDWLIQKFKEVKDLYPSARKSIEYYRNEMEIGVMFSDITVVVARILDFDHDQSIGNNKAKMIMETAKHIESFNSILDEIDRSDITSWCDFSDENLIHLRNNGVLEIWQKVGEHVPKTRLARSLFCLAGVSRLDTPLAMAARYAFLPSAESDVAMLRVQATYKCGQSTTVRVDCVHEFLLLMYELPVPK